MSYLHVNGAQSKSWDAFISQLSGCCSSPNKRYMFIHLSIRTVCAVGIPDKFAIFLACTSPSNFRRYLRYLPKAPKAIYHNAVGWSGRRQAVASQDHSWPVFPKAPIQASHATNVSKNRSFSSPIKPFEKVQPRASASLPADTKAHPRLCASQRNFGTPRSELPTRPVLSRHTCSVRPSRPQAREGCCPGCPRTVGTVGTAVRRVEREGEARADIGGDPDLQRHCCCLDLSTRGRF